MTEIIVHDVLRTILKEINYANFFSVILDETADIQYLSKNKCICFVTDRQPEEVFVGFYKTPTTRAEALFQLLKCALTRFSLPFNKL